MNISLDLKTRLNLWRQNRQHDVHLWDIAASEAPRHPVEILESLVARWSQYRLVEIDRTISEHDDMYHQGPNAEEAYLAVGLTALRLFTEAMLLGGRTEFDTILDLPCGGGRITRHLKAFFPEARIHVADAAAAKQEATVRQFGVEAFPFPLDFNGAPGHSFDLIFVGSLLTHFDMPTFDRALDFFIKALNPGGLAALTLHGRSNGSSFVSYVNSLPDARPKRRLQAVVNTFRRSGFGYQEHPGAVEQYGRSYGDSHSAPSWVLNRIERRSDCLVVCYKERSFGDVQDLIVLKKL